MKMDVIAVTPIDRSLRSRQSEYRQWAFRYLDAPTRLALFFARTLEKGCEDRKALAQEIRAQVQRKRAEVPP